ncbi:hypothetical protein BJY01DRAFT_205039 [Aspergillus pseudoustus]|uniref:Uncharacterized protein n=1 Tax=Aspergillus pseudoustus TaxID=1810923 RepID=A0ABR4KUI5_9EURO
MCIMFALPFGTSAIRAVVLFQPTLCCPSHPLIIHSSTKAKTIPVANRTLGIPRPMMFQAELSDILSGNWAGEVRSAAAHLGLADSRFHNIWAILVWGNLQPPRANKKIQACV